MNNKILIALCSFSFILGGCNSSNSNSNSSGNDLTSLPTLKTGQFLDSAVENIQYKTASQEGSTDSEGKFSYIDGETVTFSIGAIVFPAVTAADIITPFTMAGSSSINNQTVVNIAILLQSLDADVDLSNGIQIPLNAALLAKNQVDFNETTIAFKSDQGLVQALMNSFTPAKQQVEAAAAKAHLKKTIADEMPFIGSWSFKNGNTSQENLILYSDNTFVYASYDVNAAVNTAFELGTYSYEKDSGDENTGKLTLDITQESDGGSGLGQSGTDVVLDIELSDSTAHASGTASSEKETIDRLTIISGQSVLTLSVNDLATNDISGAWTQTGTKTGTDSVVAPGGTKLLVLFQYNSSTISKDFIAVNIQGNEGVEFGQYSPNSPSAGNIYFTVTDHNTNTDAGVEEFNSPAIDYELGDDELNITQTIGNVETVYVFDRSL